MTHQSEIRKARKVIAGIVPNVQDQILRMHDVQLLRPGQIAYALKRGLGGTSAVCDVLRYHGRDIDLLPTRRLAS
jgi:hypothetical protein